MESEEQPGTAPRRVPRDDYLACVRFFEILSPWPLPSIPRYSLLFPAVFGVLQVFGGRVGHAGAIPVLAVLVPVLVAGVVFWR